MSTPLPFPTGRSRSASPQPLGGIRVAGPADAQDIGRLQSALWRSAYAGILPPAVLDACTPEAFATAWGASLEQSPERHRVLLAVDGDAPVGFAVLVPADDPDADPSTARLDLIGVLPDHRLAGHGSRLINAVADSCREFGYELLTSWVLIEHESLRGFLATAGLLPDRARRTREIPAAEDPTTTRTVLEVRLVAAVGPSVDPTSEPSVDPTSEPSVDPTSEPSVEPAVGPTA